MESEEISETVPDSPRHTRMYPESSPELDALVRAIIMRVADKWTLLVLEALEVHGTLRFTQVGEKVGDISQKMLTKTLRQMEKDGFVRRTVHPVIPPKVEYALTDLGLSLSGAFCGVWQWAEENWEQLQGIVEK
jgi:DNA-binding HxlR family transcriptional regulator